MLVGDTNSGRRGLDEEVPAFSLREEGWIDGLAGCGWTDAFRHLNAAGFEATVSYLGEAVTSEAEVEGAVREFVSFAAVNPGTYFLACLVPGHIAAGMWDHFTVSTTARAPSLQIK